MDAFLFVFTMEHGLQGLLVESTVLGDRSASTNFMGGIDVDASKRISVLFPSAFPAI